MTWERGVLPAQAECRAPLPKERLPSQRAAPEVRRAAAEAAEAERKEKQRSAELEKEQRQSKYWQGAARQAEKELKEVEAEIPGGATSLDVDLYDPVFHLASLYDEAGWFAEELPLQQRCVRIVEKDLGEGHLHTTQAHLNLGCCYRELGKAKEAERHIRKCLDIRIKEVGKDHDLTKDAQEVYDLGFKPL